MLIVALLLTIVLRFVHVLAQFGPDQCSCGYFDPTTQQLFTESIVVYFNETDSLPTDVFTPDSFEHKKEKGWTTIFRQSASADNVAVGNDSQPDWLYGNENPSSLELFVNGYTSDHLVAGGAISTVRQDILYGSFRASMRSPHPYAGGSALSMMLAFDDSDTLEIDLLNGDNSDVDGRAATLINSEYQYADTSLGLNYSTIKNGSQGVPAASPWDYMDVRLDWTEDQVNFMVADYLVRSVNTSTPGLRIPDIPVPITFKHWSTGDINFMKGPPVNRSGANVAWVRAFFNSSIWSSEQHNDYDTRCRQVMACAVDDLTLRGSSLFDTTQTKPFNNNARDHDLLVHSATVAALFGLFIVLALGYPLLSKIHWSRLRTLRPKAKRQKDSSANQYEMTRPSMTPTSSDNDTKNLDRYSGSTATVNGLRYSDSNTTMLGKRFSDSTTTIARSSRAPSPRRQFLSGESPYYISDRNSLPSKSAHPYLPSSTPDKRISSAAHSRWSAASTTTELVPKNHLPDGNVTHTDGSTAERAPLVAMRELPSTNSPALDTEHILQLAKAADPGKADRWDIAEGHQVSTTSDFHTTAADFQKPIMHEVPLDTMPPVSHNLLVIAPPNVRIDYLAGVVAFACICVTFVHFTLTFLPGATGWGPVSHSASDDWAKKTIAPYLLNEAWIGPFFTTSARFLSARYLRGGKLSDIGNKTLLRAPRMVVPVAIIALFQYAFIAAGLTGAMMYLPSISWSTWPYVEPYPNFGGYINSMLDLSYLIPNAAPAVVPHYCIGVLWTIPVQLQNSYVVLIGAVMIREIKTPWKRFGFYTFCVFNHWYAFSWGSCFWLGLMLSDLSVTYKYAKWIQARWWAQYSICISMWLLAAACSTVFLAANDLNYEFLTVERGWHVEPATGLPYAQTASAGYPNYFEPRLNTILLAGALQVIVELSTTVQKFLSLKVWICVFPHIMTIYLIHGFIFWTLGATACVGMSMLGTPYWANMLVTWVVCFGILAIACPIVTPLTDRSAKWVCKMLWRWAEEEPMPDLRTLLSSMKNTLRRKRVTTDGN